MMKFSSSQRRIPSASLGICVVLLNAAPIWASPVVEPPQAQVGRPRLLVLPVQIDADETTLGSSLEALVTSSFVQTERFEVLGASEIQTLLELEGSKQLVGCEDASCAAEIAGALGAEYVVSTKLNRLGGIYVLQISLLEPARARTVGTESAEIATVEFLGPTVRRSVRRLAAQSAGERYDESTPGWGAATAGVGAALLFIGAASAAGAGAIWIWSLSTLADPQAASNLKDGVLNYGPLATGVLLYAGGGLAIVGAVALPIGASIAAYEWWSE